MNNDEIIRNELIAYFGAEAYDHSNVLNRDYIAKQVFNNPEKLSKLNRIVHPRVGVDFTNWVNQNSEASYVIKEAALIFESGAYKELDKIIHVSAPKEIRISRTLKRDPFRSREEVSSIIDKQMSEEDFTQKSDFSVVNDNNRMVLPQVLGLHSKILDLK